MIAVGRYAGSYLTKHGGATAEAYVPLSFAPGGAYQFDWGWPAMRAIVDRSSRFEALHLALTSSHHLMRIFGSIVTLQTLFMRSDLVKAVIPRPLLPLLPLSL
jgi:hypothetical protein